MIKLGEFVDKINEAAKNENVEIDKKHVVVDGKVRQISGDEDLLGKYKNRSGITKEFKIISPNDDQIEGKQWTTVDKTKLTKNERQLRARFKSHEDFMALGEAGWGKTAEIIETAKSFGLYVVVTYIDKCEATDFGGIPSNIKENGVVKTVHALPVWAQIIRDNPDKQFLLFFDEFNQADPQVQNALMPIVKEHEVCHQQFDNFLCGAAGNLSFENEEVFELSKPLKERFIPFKWECRTPDAWAAHWRWAHENYDSKIGKEPIDKLQAIEQYLECPRNNEKIVYKYLATNKGESELDVDQLKEKCFDYLVYDKLMEGTPAKSMTTAIEEFAQYMFDYCENGGPLEAKAEQGRKRKGTDNISETDKKNIIIALSQGSMVMDPNIIKGGDGKTYLISKENVIEDFFVPEVCGITAEVLERIIQTMEDSGKKVKYNKTEDGMEDAKEQGWYVKRGNDWVRWNGKSWVE